MEAASTSLDAVKPHPRRGEIRGGDWILNIPPYPIALWGEAAKPAAVRDEATMLFGPPGVGKTTLVQRYVRARLGLDGGELLGMRVSRAEKPIVYLAMDRPEQIARSFRRMTAKSEQEHLNEMLLSWRGPLPFDLKDESPMHLATWLRLTFGDVSEVIVDSYKDLGFTLTKDEDGMLLNIVMQETITSGIDWFCLHHGRKANGDNREPNTLEDVFGSRWLTAGVGSVLCLWGEPGGDVGLLKHLKQPAEPIHPEGHPLTVMHDRPKGSLWTIDLAGAEGKRKAQTERRARILQLLAESGPLARKDIAEQLDEADSTVRKDLAELVDASKVESHGEGPATRYRYVYPGEKLAAEMAARRASDDELAEST